MNALDLAVDAVIAWARGEPTAASGQAFAGLSDLALTGMRDFGFAGPTPLAEPDAVWARAFFETAARLAATPIDSTASARGRAMHALVREHADYHVPAVARACGGLDRLSEAWAGPVGPALRTRLGELVVHLGAGFARVGRVPHCGPAGRALLPGAIVHAGPGHFVPQEPPYRYVGDETALVRLHFGAPIFIDLADNSVSPELMQQGWWEPWIDGVVQKVVGRGDIGVNIGANLGYYVLRIAYLAESPGRVFAFEPNPRIIRRLARSIQWAGLIKVVTLFPFAASDKPGRLEMTFTPEMSGHGGLFASSDQVWRPGNASPALPPEVARATETVFSPAATSVTIEATTLDETVGRLTDQIHFLMIDVEQAEPLVLAGGRDLIRRSRDLTIMMEWMNGARTSPSPEMRARGIEMIRWLAAEGFRFWTIEAELADIFARPSILTEQSVDDLLAIEGKIDLFIRRAAPAPHDAHREPAVAEPGPPATILAAGNRPPTPIDLAQVFHDDDLRHFENARGVAESRVYNWYRAYGAALHPASILEIGVRRGYGAFALISGAGGSVGRYVGIDMELDLPGTNAIAEAAIRRAGVSEISLIAADTQVEFPVLEGTFDLVHVDGDHSLHGALSDCLNVLPLIAAGGTLIIDDIEAPEVNAALALLRVGFGEGAWIEEYGDLHRQALIHAKGGRLPVLSRDTVLAAADPGLRALLSVEARLRALRALDGGTITEDMSAALFLTLAEALADAIGVPASAAPVCSVESAFAIAADLLIAFESRADDLGLAERLWHREAREHGVYALERLAGIAVPRWFGDVARRPDAFRPGTSGFTAMAYEATCNLAAVLGRGVFRLVLAAPR